MSRINTAVIPVAGFGTRRLPISKAIEKCMMPIGNRPVVDYAVEDCVRAGIERIIFVVSEDSSQLQKYYARDNKLEEYLKDHGKTQYLDMVQNLDRDVEFEYIVQPSNGDYGTAVPLYLAKERLNDEEAFVMLMGDAPAYIDDETSVMRPAIEEYLSENEEHMLLGLEVPREKATSYGIMKVEDGLLVDFLEKPPLELVPEYACTNINHMIFSRSIFIHLDKYMKSDPPAENRGEYYLTDVFTNAAKSGQKVKVRPIEAELLDAGNLDGWLDANKKIIEIQKRQIASI